MSVLFVVLAVAVAFIVAELAGSLLRLWFTMDWAVVAQSLGSPTLPTSPPSEVVPTPERSTMVGSPAFIMPLIDPGTLGVNPVIQNMPASFDGVRWPKALVDVIYELLRLRGVQPSQIAIPSVIHGPPGTDSSFSVYVTVASFSDETFKVLCAVEDEFREQWPGWFIDISSKHNAETGWTPTPSFSSEAAEDDDELVEYPVVADTDGLTAEAPVAAQSNRTA